MPTSQIFIIFLVAFGACAFSGAGNTASHSGVISDLGTIDSALGLKAHQFQQNQEQHPQNSALGAPYSNFSTKWQVDETQTN